MGDIGSLWFGGARRLEAHALGVIGEHVECHLGADVSEPAHPEVCRAHPGLYRAERVIDSRAAQIHQGGIAAHAIVRRLGQMLMLPSAAGQSLLREFGK